MKNSTKALILSACIFHIMFFFWYGTDIAVNYGRELLSTYERVVALNTNTRMVFATVKLFPVAIFLSIFIVVDFTFFSKK